MAHRVLPYATAGAYGGIEYMNEPSRIHGPERDLGILAEMVTIERLKESGLAGVSALIGYLSDAREPLAAAAVRALLGMLPMAALPARWREDGIYRKSDSDTDLPAWLLDACDGWGGDEDFAHLCVRQLGQLCQETERQRFLQRLSIFMGARQRIVTSLLSSGQKSGAREFVQAATRLQQIQFPKQITLALTMNCQLSCQYCISGNIPESGFQDTQPWALEQLFGWMAKKGVNRLGLTGGEPTLYGDFEHFLYQIRDRGFELYLATNGLGSRAATAAIIRSKPLCVTMHLTPEVLGSKLEATYIRNAEELLAAGVYVIMRCNFLKTTDEPLAYLETAKKIGISEIRTAIPMPKASGGNCFVDFKKIDRYGRLLDRLAAAGRQAGVSIRLAKPFPVCYMTRPTARQFLENGSLAASCPVHFSGYTNNIIVNSDLHYAACLGLDQPSDKPIVAYSGLAQAGQAHRNRVKTLTRQPIMRTCRTCPLWLGGRCIGGCLSYRTPSPARTVSPMDEDT